MSPARRRRRGGSGERPRARSRPAPRARAPRQPDGRRQGTGPDPRPQRMRTSMSSRRPAFGSAEPGLRRQCEVAQSAIRSRRRRFTHGSVDVGSTAFPGRRERVRRTTGDRRRWDADDVSDDRATGGSSSAGLVRSAPIRVAARRFCQGLCHVPQGLGRGAAKHFPEGQASPGTHAVRLGRRQSRSALRRRPPRTKWDNDSQGSERCKTYAHARGSGSVARRRCRSGCGTPTKGALMSDFSCSLSCVGS